MSQCIIYRNYVFLLPGLVAFRQCIIHPTKGHSFRVLIFKAVVAGKKRPRPALAAGQLLGGKRTVTLSPSASIVGAFRQKPDESVWDVLEIEETVLGGGHKGVGFF